MLPLSNCLHFVSSHRLPPRRTQAIPACFVNLQNQPIFDIQQSCIWRAALFKDYITGWIELKVGRESNCQLGENGETWKGIRFVSNKRREVGRPTIWLWKSETGSSPILCRTCLWQSQFVCNWYQTNLKFIFNILKNGKNHSYF